MRCACCNKETQTLYRIKDTSPKSQGVCKECALCSCIFKVSCSDCRQWLGLNAYNTLGRVIYEYQRHYYCEQCFLKRTEIQNES